MDLLRDTARNAGGGGNDYSDESDDEEEESLDDSRPRPPVALQSPPPSPQLSIPDPHDGHVPPDKNLASCPCDPPGGPCAPIPRRFTSRRERTFSNRGGPVPQIQADNPDNEEPSPNIDQQPRQTRLFSDPKPGNFSYRRRRPDVNALRQLLLTLND